MREGPNPRTYGVRQRIAAIVLICWLIPVASLAAYASFGFASNIAQKARTALDTAAQSAQEVVVNQIQSLVDNAKAVTYDAVLENGYNAVTRGTLSYSDYYSSSREYLEQRFGRMPGFTFGALMLLDRPGQLIYNSSGHMQYEAFMASSFKRTLTIGDTLDTRCFFLGKDDELYLVRNLYNRRMERFGMLIAGIDQNWFARFLFTGPWQGQARYALDSFEKTAGGQWDFDEGFEMDAGFALADDKLVSTGRVNNKDFTFAYQVYQTAGDAYHEVGQLRLILIVMLVLMVPVLLITQMYIMRRVLRPVIELTNAAQRIREGDLDTQVAVRGVGEVRELEESFNAMSARLKHLVDQTLREQIATRDARIEALQSRVNPHFLANVLEMMNWQARLDNSMKISAMIDALSTLMDAAMDRSGAHLATIDEELALAEAYFRLVKLRFGDRLEINTRIDDAARGCMLPRLMIESLIENAVNHGVVPAGAGTVELDVRREGEFVMIEVRNIGQPLSVADKEKILTALDVSQPTDRIGLRNAKQRLELQYGDAAEISITSTDAGQTVARVKLPYNTQM